MEYTWFNRGDCLFIGQLLKKKHLSLRSTIPFNPFVPPSVYADGRVCISILHAPGDDPMGYETSAERWSPVQSVEKILLSVVSMLAGKVVLNIRYIRIK